MNPKVLELLKKYDDLLWSMAVFCQEISDGLEEDGLMHLRWMLHQMSPELHARCEDCSKLTPPDFTTDLTKMHRWLGFIQGVLWANNLQGIKELRDQTREILGK